VDAELFLTCADVAADAIGSDAVAGAWHEPSALEGYTVAGLAGHLARAVLTVDTYLSRPPVPPEGLTDASGYLATVLGDHDPIDSDLHRAVRERGREAAGADPAALAETVRRTAARLAGELDRETLDRAVEVLDGVVLTVADYLRTRLVELVVHLDDLAVSVGLAVPIPDDAARVVAGVLAETAARRDGALATVRGLSRRERHPDAVRAM
jgi:uncharacterized protein (TIGR03083 family)